MRRPRLFWKQVGRELVLRLEEITHERDQAEITRDEAKDALRSWQLACRAAAQRETVAQEAARGLHLEQKIWRDRAEAVEAVAAAWQDRAEKAEAAEAQLVEQLAQIAEHNLAEQCRWQSLTTGERCGYRDGHRGKCVDSMGRFVPGPWTAKRVGA